ncbi:MAG TPA: dihydrofolate reductase family protein [Puia sp.]|jgi:dihydrofolate reductase|nr:dihydrofolate reductase family protein [Puia sp.]
MRKIIVTTNVTLDGVIQSPSGPGEDASGEFKYGGWSVPYADENSGKAVQRYMKEKAEYLLGRKTFEIFNSFWPKHADIWPGVNEDTKYVLSRTMKNSDWKNTVFLENVEDIRKLKATEGPDIQIWGSSELIQLLLKNGLIDELHLRIFPVILGEGKKLFKDGQIATGFTLTENSITPKGVIIAFYKKTGEVKTGKLPV